MKKYKDMTGREQENILNWIKITLVCTLFIGLMFCAVRLLVTDSAISYNKACRLEYGKDWVYERSSFFGARSCVELDEGDKELNRIEINWTLGEVGKKYCNPPGFFELKRWRNDCPEIKE